MEIKVIDDIKEAEEILQQMYPQNTLPLFLYETQKYTPLKIVFQEQGENIGISYGMVKEQQGSIWFYLHTIAFPQKKRKSNQRNF